MPDINKYITNPDSASPEKKDRKIDLSEWSHAAAEQTAATEGISLTKPHWMVVDFLREHYLDHGPAASGREIAKALDETFAVLGGSRYLYQLFPDGPEAQGCRIAGLLVPPYTESESFGSTM